MSSNKNLMRPPSQKNPRTKISLTLYQQQQTQSQTADLRKQQAEMDHLFDKQSTTSYSTNNNNNNVHNFNRPSTNYQQNRPPTNPLKESQVSFQNQSVASLSSRKPNFRQFNESISKKNLSIIPEGSNTDRIRFGQPSSQANNTNIQNYQTVPVSTGGIQSRARNIQSFHETRVTHGSQHNSVNPQSQPYRYGPYEPRKIQPNNSQQYQQRFEPLSSRQTNFMKNNSTYIDPLAIKQENEQLKEKVTKLQNQLKSQKDRNTYHSKRLQQGLDEIKSLKSQVQQLQEKAKPKNGFFNLFNDKKGSQPQNKRLQNQLIETKKKVSYLQKIIKDINAEKENMKKQHQKILKEKANQLTMNMSRMNMERENLQKILKSRDERIQQLQDQVTNLQSNSKQQQQLIKMIKQNCQKQAINRFHPQLGVLENKVNQLMKEIQNRDKQKQAFTNQSLERLELYMKLNGE